MKHQPLYQVIGLLVVILTVLVLADWYWYHHKKSDTGIPQPAISVPTATPTPEVIQAPVTAEDYHNNLNEFLEQGIKVPIGSTRQEIKKNLGEPESSEVEEVENKEDPTQTAKIITYTYPDLRLDIYIDHESGQERLIHQVLTGNHYPLKWGLKIGAAKSALLQMLGTPAAEEDCMYNYIVNKDNHQETIDILFNEDQINLIEWTFDVELVKKFQLFQPEPENDIFFDGE